MIHKKNFLKHRNMIAMTKTKNKFPWLDNIISYHASGNPGSCPFCESSDVRVQTLQIGRRSINFHCSSFGKFTHIDRCVEKDKSPDPVSPGPIGSRAAYIRQEWYNF